MANKPARTAVNYEKIKKMTPEELAGYPKFKIPVKKSVRRRNFDLMRTRLAHPWLFKSVPVLPENVVLQPPRRDPKLWRPTKDAIQKLRAPYVKLPVEVRPKPNHMMMQLLCWEETKKIKANWPRTVEKFKAGDKIKITKYITLTRDSKMEVLKGMVIGITRGGTLETYVRIINYKIDVTYEMNIPYWSPFIKSIEVVQKGNYRKKKLYFMYKMPWQVYITK